MVVYSQNVVYNPSFEDAKRCTEFVGNFDSYVSFWSSTTHGSPDLFNSCSERETGIPYNYNGFQDTIFGSKYAGCYLYTDDNYREYIQGELINSLETGVEYTMSIYISLAENSDFAIRDIGFLMAAEQLKLAVSNELSKKVLKKMGVEEYSIYNFDNSEYYDNKTEWVRLEKDFYANGYEQFVTIGNFKKNSKTDKRLVVDKSKFDMAYYYIDFISIERKQLGLLSVANKSNVVLQKATKSPKEIDLNKDYVFKNAIFDFNSFELSEQAKLEIAEVYQYLNKNNGTKIIISGHTDTIGTSNYNQDLSAKRASSVAEFFRTLGLSKERIYSVGFGDSLPISTDDSQEGRSRNRRVEFKIELSN